jgi:hypothetical protein
VSAGLVSSGASLLGLGSKITNAKRARGVTQVVEQPAGILTKYLVAKCS